MFTKALATTALMLLTIGSAYAQAPAQYYQQALTIYPLQWDWN